MQVKTFEGFSMQEAVKEVRREFGNDAVILKTREKSFEDGRSRVFEITAAKSENKKIIGASSCNETPISGAEIRELATEIISLKSQIMNQAENFPGRDRIINLESGISEIRSLLIQSLRGIKGSLYEGLHPQFAELVKKLEVMGIDDCYLNQMVSHVRSLPEYAAIEQSSDIKYVHEFYRSSAIKWMLGKIKIAPDLKNMLDSLAVHVFVGATGVGKTTAIAKLAAHYCGKDKLKVIIGSFDNTRLAASEQMRIYAKVIEASFATIESLKDVSDLIDNNSDANLILIDTAGRSPKRNRLDELLPLKNLDVPVDFHVIVSATEKQDQMDRTIRSFSSLGLSSLFFTKLDETWSYGEIFNLSQKWGVPLSYFSIGQNVPEDIERASKERVIERIFGL